MGAVAWDEDPNLATHNIAGPRNLFIFRTEQKDILWPARSIRHKLSHLESDLLEKLTEQSILVKGDVISGSVIEARKVATAFHKRRHGLFDRLTHRIFVLTQGTRVYTADQGYIRAEGLAKRPVFHARVPDIAYPQAVDPGFDQRGRREVRLPPVVHKMRRGTLNFSKRPRTFL